MRKERKERKESKSVLFSITTNFQLLNPMYQKFNYVKKRFDILELYKYLDILNYSIINFLSKKLISPKVN